ncbi:hypothetical protein JCM17823_26670 [Halorubrum gandharaense]
MPKRYRNGWWLFEKYHCEEWTQAEIADECGVSPRTVRDWMERRGVETREIAGENHPLYGSSRSEDVRHSIAESLSGREVSDETRRRMSEAQQGRTLSEATRSKIAKALTGMERPSSTRRAMSEASAGANNANWKGGYGRRYGSGWSPARDAAHESQEECEHCGHDGSDRRLEVHHVVPVRRFRESEAFELSDAHHPNNLRVLCRLCHIKADHEKITVTTRGEFPNPE